MPTADPARPAHLDPAIAERLLEDDTADLIGMVRAFLADPEWLSKARRDEPRTSGPA